MFPLRWNPVRVVVRPLREAAIDTDYGERSGNDEFDTGVELQGQPNFWRGRWERQDPGYSGDQDETAGHILFKIVDLDAVPYRPKVGDVFTYIDGFAQEGTHAFRCYEVRPISPLRGRYLFLKCFVRIDRKIRGLFP
jgi:hypothetical protein